MNKLLAMMMGAIMTGCASNPAESPVVGNYAYDVALFKQCNIEAIDLSSPDGKSRVLIVPAYQGRVMTSTAQGPSGRSNGWINHEYIRKGEVAKQMHAVGGEERFWLGPEGGPYSYYFPTVENQVFDNWQVPPFTDTEPFRVIASNEMAVMFEQKAMLTNASGTQFTMQVNRAITLLGKQTVESRFGVSVSSTVDFVGYEAANTLTNIGHDAWKRETGLPAIWALSMLNSSPATTVFVPYRTDAPEGSMIYNDSYFGGIDADRIEAKNGVIHFKADAKSRGKLGVPFNRAKSIMGSYDAESGTLTAILFTLPEREQEYVNAVWGNTTPYVGDVVNAYNDGPKEDGVQFGQFYELESSSPAAALQPGASTTHIVTLAHFVGSKADLQALAKHLFNVSL